MSITANLTFDIILSKIKVGNQKQIFNIIANEACKLCGGDSDVISSLFENKSNEVIFNMDSDVAIFDIISEEITSPLLAIMTLDKPIKFSSLNNRRVNIVAAVLSPSSYGTRHLQRISTLSRVMRSHDLCTALNDINDTDTMRALFMPTQNWLAAA